MVKFFRNQIHKLKLNHKQISFKKIKKIKIKRRKLKLLVIQWLQCSYLQFLSFVYLLYIDILNKIKYKMLIKTKQINNQNIYNQTNKKRILNYIKNRLNSNKNYYN